MVCVGSIAIGEVSTTVYLADGETPLELADPNVPFVYRDIMVGTKLTIVVRSDSTGNWSGSLQIVGDDRDFGVISARDFNDVTRDWEGSHLEAAGASAGVYRSAGSSSTTISLGAGRDSVSGDWFVIDYAATNAGGCSVGFREDVVSPCPDCDPSRPPPFEDRLVHELVFSHVPTRDFNGDAKVDFVDFAILVSFSTVTNCGDLNWCEGADLDTDGDADIDDVMLFADYWLENAE